jgi:acetyltransferase
MTTRNLDALFAPRSVALVGASARPGSVGEVLVRNLLEGGFKGHVHLVDAHTATTQDRPILASVSDLPEAPDLAILATPAETVPGLIAELGSRGCRAAVVISAGFEGTGRPAELKQAMLDAARPHLLRIVGPNCLGVAMPNLGLNASFAAAMPPAGGVALISQSGAVAAAAMDWAPAHGVGFSHVLTVGDCADVDVADLLDQLSAQPDVRAILVYLEGVADGRKFMSAGRRAAAAKPVAVLKAGRGAAGAKAAFSHTGALAGASAVYEAAFRRAGLVEAGTLAELLQAGAAFAAYPSSGSRVAILTNGGGAGVLAADALSTLGVGLAELGAETLSALNAFAPAAWSHGNPVDVLGDAKPELYGRALKTLREAGEVDAVLALFCPTGVTDGGATAKEVIAAAAAPGRKPIIAGWLGERSMAEARARFAEAGVPFFDTPEAAAVVLAHLVRRGRAHEALHRAPAMQAPKTDAEAARRIVRNVLAQGRASLTDPEAREVLRAYGVPVIASEVAATPAEAGAAAAKLGGEVALKILSPDISHKSDVGGVHLGLAGAAATEAAACRMLAHVRTLKPQARIEGFIVEAMVQRPEAQEMLVGLVQDPVFGPVLAVAEGGIAVEARGDRALELPPLNRSLAREMIARTRVRRLLAGYRGRAPADLDALSACLVAVGRLALDVPEIAELDINPLLCDPRGALALDARIALKAVGAGAPRPAGLPDPGELGGVEVRKPLSRAAAT